MNKFTIAASFAMFMLGAVFGRWSVPAEAFTNMQRPPISAQESTFKVGDFPVPMNESPI
jgi:hypothetical protein